MGLGIVIAVDNQPNQALTDQAGAVEIVEKMDEATAYTIRFLVDICDNDVARALETNTDPGSVLSVLVDVNGTLHCLVKGPVNQQNAGLQHGGPGSFIDVRGVDTASQMDVEPASQAWSNVTDSDIATTIISRNGMQADVQSTPGSAHLEDNHSHVQRETDLSALRRLARRNGYHFWITYDTTGNATGHFRPRSLDGEASATLIINEESYNIERLGITVDTARPTQTEGQQIDLRTGETIDGQATSADETALGAAALPAVAGSDTPRSINLAPTADDSGTMQARSRAVLAEAQWFIQATTRTSLDRLCRLVRAHTLVEVRGAGSRHSGKYYVTEVKHTITAAAHTMDLHLARNAWGNEAGGALGLPTPSF